MYLRDGEQLERMMNDRGLSQYQLASLVTVRRPSGQDRPMTRAEVSHLTSGRRHNVKPDVAEQIARCLGVAPGKLFDPRAPRKARRCPTCHGTGYAPAVDEQTQGDVSVTAAMDGAPDHAAQDADH